VLHHFLLCCPCPCKTLPYHPSPLLSRHHLSPRAAPLLCWLVVASPPLSLHHHLSCTGCFLNCHLSPRITASLYHAYHALRCSLNVVVAAPPSLLPLACHHRRCGDDRSSTPTDPPPPPGHICIVDVNIIDNNIIQPPHDHHELPHRAVQSEAGITDLFDCCVCSAVVSSPLPHLVVAISPTTSTIIIVGIVLVVAVVGIVIHDAIIDLPVVEVERTRDEGG